MPLVMLLALNIVSYTYISPLYETTIGRMIMTGAMGATGYGVYLMEKIADIHI